MDELFFLLHFLEPKRFPSLEAFTEEFSMLDKEEHVHKLHGLLKPHMLRRTKEDVNLNIPEKRELIVRVELSSLQKELYRWVGAKCSILPVLDQSVHAC